MFSIKTSSLPCLSSHQFRSILILVLLGTSKNPSIINHKDPIKVSKPWPFPSAFHTEASPRQAAHSRARKLQSASFTINPQRRAELMLYSHTRFLSFPLDSTHDRLCSCKNGPRPLGVLILNTPSHLGSGKQHSQERLRKQQQP